MISRLRAPLTLVALLIPAIVGATAYDFDGDGRADPAVYLRPSGTWLVQQSGGVNRTLVWGARAMVPAPGDYDGDGRTDIAVFNRRVGGWLIERSATMDTLALNWGRADTTAVPADYDGDGTTDVAVYQQSAGIWYVRKSTGGLGLHRFGGAYARPVPADYDGDGRADLAVYEWETGTWRGRLSGGGTFTDLLGGAESQPMPADYDGDGRADVAVYHVPSGNWTIHYATGGSFAINFGWVEATPVPADYDGDGIDDIAVFHPTAGNWYLRLSAGGVPTITWGIGGRAVPAFARGARDGHVVLAFGDSITYGTGSSSGGPATAYPTLLEKVLEGSFGGDFLTVNRGVPGEFTRDGRTRLPSVLDEVQPDVLLLMEGTNDHQLRRAFSEIQSNLSAMVAEGVARGVHVVIATIPPVISVPGYDRADQMARITAFNPTIPAIANLYGVAVARVYEGITAVTNWENTLMEHTFGNHPNDAGYVYVRNAFFDPPLVDGLNAGKSY